MSIISLDKDALENLQIGVEDVHALAASRGLKLREENVDDFRILLAGMEQVVQEVLAMDDYVPTVDYDLYSRTDIHVPEDTNKGGWATRCTVKSTKPTSDLLKGKTLAIKDNIAVAGVRCTNGTAAVPWTPEIDATLVTRILDAGGVITGKSACEDMCYGCVSDTSITGPVHNPYGDNYSCGGSSSGSARLVAVDAVDMAIGADQGGSIRIPAAACGLVGLKPTWGLVPYSGCIGIDAIIDYVGPMTKTVADCALLLEVIAGSDGMDDRQPASLAHGSTKYSSEVAAHLASAPAASPLQGIKIGVLREGFANATQDANVERSVRAAIDGLAALGATVAPVSVPAHLTGGQIAMAALPYSAINSGFRYDGTGRKQLVMTDRAALIGGKVSQEMFDAFGPSAQNVYLRGVYMQDKYGPALSAKCTNLIRKQADAFDRALSDFDILVMPTAPAVPAPILTATVDGKSVHPGKVIERLTRTIGIPSNTAIFNSSGHPALSLPVGFAPAKDNSSLRFPVGMQLVGRKFEDLLLLKVAASWEKAYSWREL